MLSSANRLLSVCRGVRDGVGAPELMKTGNYAFLLPANRLEFPVSPPKKYGVTSYNTTNYNFTLSFTAFTSPLRAGGRFFVLGNKGNKQEAGGV